MKTYLGTLAALLVASMIIGCGAQSSAPDAQPTAVITPSDGSTDIPTDAAIKIVFVKPADRAVVERSFRLISAHDMADTLCPLSHTMGHGDMMRAMSDSGMMRHLDSRHLTAGRIAWNTNNTQCTFMPDSALRSRTQYMIHMGGDMMTMMAGMGAGSGGMMGGGMMNGGQSTGMQADKFMHFTTR